MKFEEKVQEVAALVIKKNKAYGNSFGTAGEALRILYPEGIKPDQYESALLVTRIWDKMKRLATANDPYGEDPFVDIAGYAICGATLKEKPVHSNLPYAATHAGNIGCICGDPYLVSDPMRECPLHPYPVGTYP